MSQNALLTGISGFIGEALSRRLLAAGWTVHAIVRPGSELARVPHHQKLHLHVHNGGTDELLQVVEKVVPDVVFHLASLFLADHNPAQIDSLVQSNLLFPLQLMEAMARTGVRCLVDTGTAWQHFEGAAYRPVNLYAATKQAEQDLLAYYVEAKGLSAITLKLFDTYGLGDPRRKLIRILTDAVRTGERLDMSPGEQVVDLSHIDDVVDAFVAASQRLMDKSEAKHETFFVSGERCTVRELVAQVEIAAGGVLDVNFGGRPYRYREVMLPYEPAVTELVPGWTRSRNLSGTLPELLAG